VTFDIYPFPIKVQYQPERMSMKLGFGPCLAAAVVLMTPMDQLSAATTETQRLYLSGQDKDHTVPWRFLCTSGAHSGVWTNLPVPSHWDMHGFGTLTYHKDATNAWDERGLYEHDFTVPAEWSGKRVFLVFEGVMTDTTAKWNGEVVGPMHQGGFYRFKHEVTKWVRFGATNRLEVTVARHSANESVNKAERLADYWVFGGIYRPVYLEAVPARFIERVAIDAKADGAFAMDAFADGAESTDRIEAQITRLDGTAVGAAFQGQPGEVSGGTATNPPDATPTARLTTRIPSPLQWTAETPNLYSIEVRLKRGGEPLHTYRQRFGFRTMEVREGDGLYVNGRKVILKGVCRHSFWPDSGRCLSAEVHRLDIRTIHEMNGNAVRMSHYPPDAEFLDLCDELGLYVLDELGGWHNHYDTAVGSKLVAEMLARDVNHPCILFWDNGNEGGWNTALDPLFGKYDPQQRRVLHPWAPFSGVNTAHYLAYENARIAATGAPMNYHAGSERVDTNLPNGFIYMPTEFMHGLFDGGAGAGLEDYWSMMMSHSNCAGGFIWVLEDDAVKRPDTGKMDTAGNQAPDGIVGPYREREGSYYTIRDMWSPIVIREKQLPPDFAGKLTLENHSAFTDTTNLIAGWSLVRFPGPNDTNPKSISVQGGVVHLPSIAPGQTGTLQWDLPEAWKDPNWRKEMEALELEIALPNGGYRSKWVWPLRVASLLPANAAVAARADRSGEPGNPVELKHKDMVAHFDAGTGGLLDVTRGGKSYALRGGPRVIAGKAGKVTWQLREDGWLQCRFSYTATGTNHCLGVTFDYPEAQVKTKRWLGQGPYRVWKNRLRGGTLGVWTNAYNNTITGYRDWVYPEFKGYFADVRWLQLETTEGPITVVPENIPYVQVLTPEFPPTNLVGHAIAPMPKCGLGFLHAIPPIGTKFKGAETTGPQGQPNVGQGEYSGTVSFYFGGLP
jgi:hypothetical protein